MSNTSSPLAHPSNQPVGGNVADEIRGHVHLIVRVRPVGNRLKPGRLDEAKFVGRDCHPHFMTSA